MRPTCAHCCDRHQSPLLLLTCFDLRARYDAVKLAAPGDGLLLLADSYLAAQTATPAALWAAAGAKKLKVFLEYPAQLPLNTTGYTPPKPGPSRPPPCLPRPAALPPKKGIPALFEYRNHDEALCASRGNKVWINTTFAGGQCGGRDDILWQSLVTKHPRGGLSPTACSWAASVTPEYCGKGCGIAPVWSNAANDPGTQNVTQFIPMWFCPPAGYERNTAGGTWEGGSAGRYVHARPVAACEEQCHGSPIKCLAFSVQDADVPNSTGCTIYTPATNFSAFTPRLKTTAYVKPRPPSPPPPPRPPPLSKPMTLRNWNALRESTGAQPAAYRGVMQPRMSAAVAAAWKRAGLNGLDIVEHWAAQITAPSGWPVRSLTPYCHGATAPPKVDCTLEEVATVHAYSTIAAGYDCAVFGIDTLSPAVVPSPTCKPTSSPRTPSAASVGSVPLLYELNADVTGGASVFVASTKISDLIAHRFAPRDHWRAVLTYLVQEFFGLKLKEPLPLWTPAVRPSYSMDAILPASYRTDAVVASTDWFFEERGPPPGELMCNYQCGSGCNRCQAPPGVDWPGSFGMQTSANMSMFYKGPLNCGTKPVFRSLSKTRPFASSKAPTA